MKTYKKKNWEKPIVGSLKIKSLTLQGQGQGPATKHSAATEENPANGPGAGS